MSGNKSDLAKSELAPISPEALESFQENRNIIIKETVSRSLKRDH